MTNEKNNMEEIEYEICENCEAKIPADELFHDIEGVAICPNCWNEIKDLIKVVECDQCGDACEEDDIIIIDGKPYCDICAEAKSVREYNIGDIVPYKNTKGCVKLAEITSFETIKRNGKVWFNGIDTVTKAKVWYPVHISKTLRL